MTTLTPALPFDVFISHSSSDQDWVLNELISKLEAAGVKCCYYQEHFDLATPIQVNIERAVAQSRKTLLVMTPAWLNSEWTELEALLAQQNSPAFRDRQMLVLKLKPCDPPKRISLIPALDCTNPANWNKQLQRLLDAINDKVRLQRAIAAPFVLPQTDESHVFTGRDVQLTLLADLLVKREAPKLCSIVGLAGTGGVGKSALACHFAEQHKEEFPDGVFGLRVDGKEIDTIAREFARLVGEEVDPDDGRSAATIMQEAFRHRRALLIFDNADDAAVKALRPGGDKCAVIITTRDRGLPIFLGVPESGQIDLPPLPELDSRALLEKLLGKGRVTAEPEAVEQIILLVGGLPLALRIVGATLQLQKTRRLADYAESLSAERERLKRLSVRGVSDLDVRASLSLSLKLLEDAEIDLLASVSVCAQDGFTVRAASAAGGCSEAEADERLQYLYRLSLLNHTQSGADKFVFHPLVRVFAQDLAIERHLSDEAAKRHGEFFIGFVKSGRGKAAESDALLLNELDDVLVATHWLLSQRRADYEFAIRLEPFFQRNGYWHQASELMTSFLKLAMAEENWYAVAQFKIQQAKFLTLRGEFKEAEKELAQIESIISQIEFEEERDRCEAMWLNTLGVILHRRGNFAKAIEAYQRSHELLVKVNDQLGQAKVLNGLGKSLQKQGRFGEAVEAFEESSAIEEQEGNHRGLAMALNSLGGALQDQGSFERAADCFRRSAVIEAEIGNQRGQAIVLNGLGGVLQRQGTFSEAEAAFRRSLEIIVRIVDKRGEAMVLNSLGGVLQRLGRFEEAVEALKQSAVIEDQIGNQRGEAMVLNSLGGVLQRLGRFEEAVKAFERSYEISEKLEDQRSLAMVLNSLGGVLQRLGRFEEAVKAFERSYPLLVESGDERGQAMVLNSLGGVLQRLGRFEEAVKAFERSYEISEKLEDQRSLAMVLNSLGGVLQRLGRFEEAVKAFERSYPLLVESGDERGQAMVLNSLGGVLQRLGRFEEAVKAFERSYPLLVESGDERGQAMVLNSLGGVLARLERFDEAVRSFEQSIVLGERRNDEMHLAKVHTSFGKALFYRRENQRAFEHLRKAFEIEERKRSPRGIVFVAPLIVKTLRYMRRYDDAANYLDRALKIAPNDSRLRELRKR